MDRRRFLKQSSIGLAGATLWSCGGSQVADVKKTAPAATESLASILENSPFRFGFQSYSLRHFSQTEDLAGEAEKLGLLFVEVYSGHLPTDATDEGISRFKQALDRVGVEVNAFGRVASTWWSPFRHCLMWVSKARSLSNTNPTWKIRSRA